MVNLDSKEVLWVNKTPSSTMYCRPLKFVLTKENPVLVKQMHNDFIEKFKNLECSVIDTNGSTVEVSYDMLKNVLIIINMDFLHSTAGYAFLNAYCTLLTVFL